MATEVASPPAAAVKVYAPPDRVQKGAAVSSMEQYREMYGRSLQDPEVGRAHWRWESRRHPPPHPLDPFNPPVFPSQGFWGELMERFHWHKKWDSGKNFHK